MYNNIFRFFFSTFLIWIVCLNNTHIEAYFHPDVVELAMPPK